MPTDNPPVSKGGVLGFPVPPSLAGVRSDPNSTSHVLAPYGYCSGHRCLVFPVRKRLGRYGLVNSKIRTTLY